MRPFTGIPFLRILLPYVTGILLAFATTVKVPFWILPSLTLLLLLAMFRNNRQNKIRILLLADAFLFCLGMSMTSLSAEHPGLHYFKPDGIKRNYLVRISDVPVPRPKSVKCEVEVLAFNNEGKAESCEGKALLYIRNSALNAQLKAGASLQVMTALSRPDLPGNPGEFDYATYLATHHVRGIGFCDSASFILQQEKPAGYSAKQAGLQIKTWVIAKLRSSDLDQSAFAICCALLTGYDDEIEKGTMNAFAHSGTLHVLSVSGLHTGLIYAAFSFLWGLADRKKKYKFTEFGLVTLILWLFALMTGFSAPVLRAVIMFNLMGFGRIFFRQNYRNQMNVLLVSAFMLLLYDPWLLRDAGFLLSYFAMFGLFYFQPPITGLWQPESRARRYLWTGVTSSVAATLSTLPITLYMFRQFPLWFIVCNLVVVPCTFILLFLALAVLLNMPGAAFLANRLTDLMYTFIQLFDHRGSGYLENLDFDFSDVLFLSLLLLFFSLALELRSKRVLVLGFLLLISWQIAGLWSSYNTKKQTCFTDYALRRGSLLSVKCRQTLHLQYTDSNSLDFTLKPHLAEMSYPDIFPHAFNFIEGSQNTVLFLDSMAPRITAYDKVNIVVLRNGFKGNIPDMYRYKKLRVIVAEQGTSKKIRRAAADLCRNFGLRFHALPENGAYMVDL